jgi:molecular chaperone HtpG
MAVADQETFGFQAEVVQLLDLMINSLYSNKEIFLRELISNASDAIDRLRLELLAKGENPEDEGPLQIRVSYDRDAGTITVADNGIGMSRAEVIEHIGTIAKSGTREFFQALTGDQRKDATLIGQFGVGFYSAFIVADRVELTTRRAGLTADEAVRWNSDGRGQYTLEAAERPGRGTTVVLHVRDDDRELLSGYQLRAIIAKYSDHISLPIVMPAEKRWEAPAEKRGEGAEGGAGGAGAAGAEGAEGAAEAAEKRGDGGEGAAEAAEETVNQASALWTRPKNEISDQDYIDFYKHIASDYADPLSWVHSKIEGTYEYTLLLFIPSRAPFDLWLVDSSRGVRLHVRRIFIMEDSGQLMPRYLRFIRGVIDSADLPLNVSRELLQGSRVVDRIRSSAVKKVLQLLKDLAEKEPDKYATFTREFGAVLKEGIVEDLGNRDEIARLVRFTTTQGEDVPLADYVARMKDGQDKIYYLLAPTLAAARSSPHLESFRAKEVEVLLLADVVDNWLVTTLREFEGKQLQSVAQGTADLGGLTGDAEKAAQDQASTEFAGLAAKLKELLDGQAWDVRVTSRLTTSPACIVANEPTSDINLMQRLRGSGLPSQPVLEINPKHPLVERLNRTQDDPRLADWASVLFNQAVLTLGARIDDPAAFVTRLNDLLTTLTDEEKAAADEPGSDGREVDADDSGAAASDDG